MFVVKDEDTGLFLTPNGKWTSEFPDAMSYATLPAAIADGKRAARTLASCELVAYRDYGLTDEHGVTFCRQVHDDSEPIDYDQHDRNAAASERIENLRRER